MKKLFFILVLALATVFNFSAKAQSNFFYVRLTGSNQSTYINATTIGITTVQKTTIGGPDNTLTVTPPGGVYSNPQTVFAYGAYWTTPSLFLPLNITIAAGYTATVFNTQPISRKAYLQIGLYNALGDIDYYNSSVYTIPANSSVVIPIPACSQTYTKTPGLVYAGDAYPTAVVLQSIDAN